MSKWEPDCTILIVGFNQFRGGIPPDPPSFQGFFLFVIGTPGIRMYKNDHVCMLKILLSMSELGGLRKHKNIAYRGEKTG